MSDNISSFKFFKETSILNKLFRSFFLISVKNGQRKKKWSVLSVFEQQPHIGLGVSLKLWRNLCLCKWLNFNRSLDNNLTANGSWRAKRDLCFKLKNSLNIDLRCLILLASLSELSSLYHSLTQKEKNDCLKCLIPVQNWLEYYVLFFLLISQFFRSYINTFTTYIVLS